MPDPDRRPVQLSERGERLLKRATHGVLTTVRHRDGLLSANPVGYTWDGETIRISTLTSRVKHRNVVEDPRVALCVVSLKDPTHYLELRGRARVEPDPGGAYAREQFRAIAGQEPPDDLDPPGSERVILAFEPEQLSAPRIYDGRFDELVPD